MSIPLVFPIQYDNKLGIDYYISQYFGQNLWNKYIEWGLKGHNGVDIPCNIGTPVRATHDGIVQKYVEEDVCMEGKGRGLGVYLRSKLPIDGLYLVTIYWHLSEFKIDTNQEVKKGDVIGLSGDTGCSTGPHLHYGKKYYDINFVTINNDNGYNGYIDPMPELRMFQQPVLRVTPESQDQYIPAPIAGKRDILIDNEDTLHTLVDLGHLPGTADSSKVIPGRIKLTVSKVE